MAKMGEPWKFGIDFKDNPKMAVGGRQRRLEFRVEVPAGTLDAFVAALSATFGGADVFYVVVPVIRSAHLREIGL